MLCQNHVKQARYVFLVTVGVPGSRSKVICLLLVQHTKDLLQQLLCSISLYCTGGTGEVGWMDLQFSKTAVVDLIGIDWMMLDHVGKHTFW